MPKLIKPDAEFVLRSVQAMDPKPVPLIALCLLVVACDANQGPARDSGPNANSILRKPFYLGMAYHLENWPAWTKESEYDRGLASLNELVDEFTAAGATVTLESGCNGQTACGATTDCINFNGQEEFASWIAAGHAIGLHADVCGKPNCKIPPPECADEEGMAEALVALRGKLEFRAGQIQHVSGVCSTLDWTEAARGTGFSFVNGVVRYCLMSLDPTDPDYPNPPCPEPSACHDAYPATFPDYLHPWRTPGPGRRGLDWTDAEEVPAILEGVGILPSRGTFKCLSELRDDLPTGPQCSKIFEDDRDALFAEIDRVISHRDGKEISHFDALTVRIDVGYPNVIELRSLLAEIQKRYVAPGHLVWATYPEMFEAYDERP